MPMTDLQTKYAAIIQESAQRKGAGVRVVKFAESCQSVLALENPAEAKIAETITEADVLLSWLKLQESAKTEDGQQYPASAFAYAPSDNVSDWKLRLWEDPEKKITKAQLGRAAAALSPGGFRGQRVEIPKDELSAVKRKIRAAYRSLDVEDEDMPKWVQEAQMRLIIADQIPLTEATVNGKGIAQIVVIKPGLNASKERYYAPETLARDFGLFEGVKMYADHPTEADDKARPERSIKDWVATLKNVRVDSKGQLIGEAHVVEPWMQAKLAALRDKNMLAEMGISINAVGTATKGTIEGTKTNVIERIARVRSVDFVTEPGAGGRVEMYESTQPENDVDIITMETLRERRPDLVKAVEDKAKESTILEVKKVNDLETKLAESEKTVAAVTKERDELKAKITEAEKAQRIAEAKSKIDEAIGKSELPEAAKVRLAESFKGREKVDGITEAIKSEADYITALKESGKVKDLGGSKPDPEKSRKELKESFLRLGMTDAQAETAVNGR